MLINIVNIIYIFSNIYGNIIFTDVLTTPVRVFEDVVAEEAGEDICWLCIVIIACKAAGLVNSWSSEAIFGLLFEFEFKFDKLFILFLSKLFAITYDKV